MIYLLHTTFGLIVSVYFLWVFYVALMRLKMVRDAGQLTKSMLYMSMPTLFLGYILDFTVNAVIGSICFIEFPKELTLSRRLYRWSFDEGWRGIMANSVRASLLDNIDPNGIHKG